MRGSKCFMAVQSLIALLARWDRLSMQQRLRHAKRNYALVWALRLARNDSASVRDVAEASAEELLRGLLRYVCEVPPCDNEASKRAWEEVRRMAECGQGAAASCVYLRYGPGLLARWDSLSVEQRLEVLRRQARLHVVLGLDEEVVARMGADALLLRICFAATGAKPCDERSGRYLRTWLRRCEELRLERAIVSLIEQMGAATVTEIAAALGLDIRTIRQIVMRLVDAGVVEVTEVGRSRLLKKA